MKKKYVYYKDITISLVDSKAKFRFPIDSDYRLKDIANEMARKLDLNPISTEWKFHLPYNDRVEIPLIYTIRQIREAHGPQVKSLMAKIMSAKVVDEEKDLIEPKLRFYNYAKNRLRHVKTSNVGTQANQMEMKEELGRLKYEELFSVSGLRRINKFKEMITFQRREQKKKKEEIWDKIQTIQKHRILRGFGVIGFCRNKNCHNFEKFLMVGMGFGEFRFDTIHEKVICELCPRKDMLPKALILVGVYFKDCRWRVRDDRRIDMKDRDELKKYKMFIGFDRKVSGVKKFLVEGTIFEYNKKGLMLEVKKLPGYNFVDNNYRDVRDSRWAFNN